MPYRKARDRDMNRQGDPDSIPTLRTEGVRYRPIAPVIDSMSRFLCC